MQQSSRCESIVLGVMDYREADKIVTLFALEHGKIKGIARGAKRSVRRFGGALEPFARLSVQLVLKGSLARIEGADVVTLHPRIREDLLKIAYAGYACDLADALLPEDLPNPRLFRLLDAWLAHLDVAPAASSDRRFFEINLLNILGYRPDLEHCAACRAVLSTGSGHHRAGPGGELLCSRCGDGYPCVSAATIRLLGTALRTGRFGAIVFTSSEAAEAGALLESAIAAHLSRPLKSLHFLKELDAEASVKVS